MLEKIDIVDAFAAKIRHNYSSSRALSQRLILSTCHCTHDTRYSRLGRRLPGTTGNIGEGKPLVRRRAHDSIAV